MTKERLIIKDEEDYSIEVDDNYWGSGKEKLAENPEADVVLVMITSPRDEHLCVSLSVEKAELLIKELQSLIKELKG